MKKQFYLTLVLLLLVPFILTAGSKNMGPGGGHQGGMMGSDFGPSWVQNQRMLNRLNLTEKQLDKIYKIRTATEKALIDMGASLRKAEIDLKDASFAEKIDESKIKNLIKKINKIRGKIFEKISLAKLEGWKVLTPEQRKSIKNYMLYRRKNFRNKRKKKW